MGKINLWPAEDLARLKKLYLQGMTARQIGEALDRTRSSVTTKLSHMRRAREIPDRVAVGPVNYERQLKDIPVDPEVEHARARVAEEAIGVSLLELSACMCAGVLGGEGVDLVLCGAPVCPGDRYCANHQKLYYNKQPSNIRY